jgi:hypothetical protein
VLTSPPALHEAPRKVRHRATRYPTRARGVFSLCDTDSGVTRRYPGKRRLLWPAELRRRVRPWARRPAYRAGVHGRPRRARAPARPTGGRRRGGPRGLRRD